MQKLFDHFKTNAGVWTFGLFMAAIAGGIYQFTVFMVSAQVTPVSARVDAEVKRLDAADGNTNGNFARLEKQMNERFDELKRSIGLNRERIDLLNKQIDTKTSQLNQTVDTKITRLSQTVDTKISLLSQKIDTKISQLNQKFDSKITMLDRKLDKKIELLDQKIEKKFGQLDQKISRLDEKMDKKFDLMDEKFNLILLRLPPLKK